jgi:hypothetical protein
MKIIDPLDYEYDTAFVEIQPSVISEVEEDFAFNDICALPEALDYLDTDRSVISWYGEEYTVRPEFIKKCSDLLRHLAYLHTVPTFEEGIPF